MLLDTYQNIVEQVTYGMPQWGDRAFIETARRISDEIAFRHLSAPRMWGGLSVVMPASQQQITFEQPANQIIHMSAPQQQGLEYGMGQLAITTPNAGGITAGTSENAELEAIKRKAEEAKKQLLVEREKASLKAVQDDIKAEQEKAFQVQVDRERRKLENLQDKLKHERLEKEDEAEAEAEDLKREIQERKRAREAQQQARLDDERRRAAEREHNRRQEDDALRRKREHEAVMRENDRKVSEALEAKRRARYREKEDAVERERLQRESEDRIKTQARIDGLRIEQERHDSEISSRRQQTFITQQPQDPSKILVTSQDKDLTLDLYWYLGLIYSDMPSAEQINQKYKESISRHHPDKQLTMSEEQRKRSQQRAQEIMLAKSILLDPERKKAYDEKHVVSDAAFENWKRWKKQKAAVVPYKN